MNKQQRDDTIVGFLASMVIWSFLYIIGVFVHASFDITKWHPITRVVLGLACLGLSIMMLVKWVEHYEKEK